MKIAVVTYFIAIIISFFIAGLIQLMATILTKIAEKHPAPAQEAVEMEPIAGASDESAIAAVIAIAKNQ